MLDFLSSVQIITASLKVLNTNDVLIEVADIDWSAQLDHADAHSLTPLLWSRWRGMPWASRLPPEIKDRLDRALHDNQIRQANVCAELLEISALLNQVQVPHIVLKGYPLAERLYQAPSERVIYDHDFLVPLELAEQAHRALLEAGFKPLPGKDEWVEKHLPSVWRNTDYNWDGYLFDPSYPRPVELHVRLWEDGWRGLRVNALPDVWRDAIKREVAGREMVVLSDEDTLVHLAMHFAGHLIEREARLNQLFDLAVFVSQTALQWATILAKSKVAGVGRFVYGSLWLAHQIFGSPLPPVDVWAELATLTPRAFRCWLAESGKIDVLTSSYRQRHKGRDYELTFMAARSWSERLGIVRFAALPPLEQLSVKYELRYRWLAPLMYPRFFLERVMTYGGAVSHSFRTDQK
jgi:hypothetical protein